MHKERIPRRNYMSNPRAQITIILVFIFIITLCTAAFSFVGILNLRSFGASITSLSLTAENLSDVKILFRQQNNILFAQLVISLIISWVPLILGMIYLSHTIGGPVFHLVQYMRHLRTGDCQPRLITFRKHDFFADLASEFNSFQKFHQILEEEPNDSPNETGEKE